MGEFLSKVLSIIESLIAEIDSLNNPESHDTEVSQELFFQNLENIHIDVIRYLSFSLLSGEYVRFNTILHDLTRVRSVLDQILDKANLLPLDIQSNIFEFQSNISVLIETYKAYASEIENYYSEDRVEFLYSQNNEINRLLYGRRWGAQESIKRATYFFTLIQLSRIDHFPSNEKNYISRLLEVENDLRELGVQDYSLLTQNVQMKIDFLKHKWRARKFDESPGDFLYSIDGEINTITDFNGINTKLNQWKDIIETQYELISNNWKSILEKRVRPYKSRSLNTLSFLELNQCIKYFKDIAHDELQLEKINQEIRVRLERERNKYDKYAIGIIHNYASNNRFSLSLENVNDFHIAENKYLEIKKNERESVDNFFVIFKYLDFSCKYFTKLINEEEKITYIKKYESIIDRLHSQDFEVYREKKEWSLRHHNYVFILPFEECLVETEGLEELKEIFYASSFVLPPSKIEIDKNYAKIKESFENLRLYIKTGKYFSNETSKIQSLTNELDKKDFKSIEIISIFTAIITFVLSSIPTYKFIDTVAESLLFMLSLASSMSIFIILILFTTRSLYKKWQAYVVILILFSITGIGYYSLFLSDSKPLKKEIKLNGEI